MIFLNKTTDFTQVLTANTYLKVIRLRALENNSIISISTTESGNDIIKTDFISATADFYDFEVEKLFYSETTLFFTIFAGSFNIELIVFENLDI